MTRIIFAGGGTGGHLYPGMAIARALVRRGRRSSRSSSGARRGIERDVLPDTEFPHALLDLHPLYRSAVVEQLAGRSRARRARGGASGRSCASSGPRSSSEPAAMPPGIMLAYSVVHRIPIVQQVGDSFPGLTARGFSRWSREIYLNFPEAAARAEVAPSGGRSSTPARRSNRRRRHGPTGAPRARAWGFPARGRPRPAGLRRKPGIAGDQPRGGASGSSAACPTICTSSGEPAGRRTTSSSISSATRARARLSRRRSPTRMPPPTSRCRAPVR